MTQRNSQETEEHQELIRRLISEFKSRGAVVLAADVDHYSRPREINGHIPDVVARYAYVSWIGEAETESTIRDEHTKKQWLAFASTNANFYVIVPKGLKGAAERVAAEAGIPSSKITIWG